MDLPVGQIIAAITASLMTLFELDRTFYIPAKTPRKIILWGWWCTFIFANGYLASVLYDNVKDLDQLKALPLVLKSILIGCAYLALIRIKVSTITYHGTEVPFGLEAFYEAAKQFIYRRIDNFAERARNAETQEWIAKYSMEDLSQQAELKVEQTALTQGIEKLQDKQWILNVVGHTERSDFAKKAALSDYILSGQKHGGFG